MLGVKNDLKKKQKIYGSIDKEGVGVGFMDFLDNIEKIVHKKDISGYKKTDYDFNDDEKEVLLDEADLAKMAG